MSNTIFVVTHKHFVLPSVIAKKGYTLITVNGQNDNSGEKDSSGENIAQKNSTYCELTAAYWIWKNSDAAIKGFCHYRRYFSNPSYTMNLNKVLSLCEVEDLLRAGERRVVLPERKYYNISSRELYLRCGYEKDLQTTRTVIKELYPSYIKKFDSLLEGNTGHLANMFVAPARIYDEYCSWLFDILFEVEKRTDLHGYTKAERRIFGYLSERLLDVWLEANHIHEAEYQVVNPEVDRSPKYMFKQLAMRSGVYKPVKSSLWAIHKSRAQNSR